MSARRVIRELENILPFSLHYVFVAKLKCVLAIVEQMFLIVNGRILCYGMCVCLNDDLNFSTMSFVQLQTYKNIRNARL